MRGREAKCKIPSVRPCLLQHGLLTKVLSAPYPFNGPRCARNLFFLGAVCPQTPEGISTTMMVDTLHGGATVATGAMLQVATCLRFRSHPPQG